VSSIGRAGSPSLLRSATCELSSHHYFFTFANPLWPATNQNLIAHTIQLRVALSFQWWLKSRQRRLEVSKPRLVRSPACIVITFLFLNQYFPAELKGQLSVALSGNQHGDAGSLSPQAPYNLQPQPYQLQTGASTSYSSPAGPSSIRLPQIAPRAPFVPLGGENGNYNAMYAFKSDPSYNSPQLSAVPPHHSPLQNFQHDITSSPPSHQIMTRGLHADLPDPEEIRR
jgi:hypothetical protein